MLHMCFYINLDINAKTRRASLSFHVLVSRLHQEAEHTEFRAQLLSSRKTKEVHVPEDYLQKNYFKEGFLNSGKNMKKLTCLLHPS